MAGPQNLKNPQNSSFWPFFKFSLEHRHVTPRWELYGFRIMKKIILGQFDLFLPKHGPKGPFWDPKPLRWNIRMWPFLEKFSGWKWLKNYFGLFQARRCAQKGQKSSFEDQKHISLDLVKYRHMTPVWEWSWDENVMKTMFLGHFDHYWARKCAQKHISWDLLTYRLLFGNGFWMKMWRTIVVDHFDLFRAWKWTKKGLKSRFWDYFGTILVVIRATKG